MKEDIERIVALYPPERRFALAAMQDMQRQFNYIPAEGLDALSAAMGIPIAQLYSMATFYRALSLKPKGRHIIKICDGTACHISGSEVLAAALHDAIGIRPGEVTEDGAFSLETVNCLGSCAVAPVMLIDDTHFGGVTPDRLAAIIEEVGAK
ncbi:MAG: NADH-quinone oxidoreductase subunit NuoE [Clostridiales Family XIII bacterium]|jgi:NADH-quinone oxidoreductase subunit E|nr:NADH-quinone oxidoreductase subunit NuoE [Clostridiales Family XIII bacterium]